MDRSVPLKFKCMRKKGVPTTPEFHCGLEFTADQMVPSHSSCRSCFNAAARHRTAKKKEEDIRKEEALKLANEQLRIEQLKVEQANQVQLKLERERYLEREREREEQLKLERLNIGLESKINSLNLELEQNNFPALAALETELENIQSESEKLKALLDNKTETLKVVQEENKRIQDKVEWFEAQSINKIESTKVLKK